MPWAMGGATHNTANPLGDQDAKYIRSLDIVRQCVELALQFRLKVPHELSDAGIIPQKVGHVAGINTG